MPPMKSFRSISLLSMLTMLQLLGMEYNRINIAGRWAPQEDLQVLALTANLTLLQTKFSSLQQQLTTLQAHLAKSTSLMHPPQLEKLQKPPPYKADEPKVVVAAKWIIVDEIVMILPSQHSLCSRCL
jgi:hypothetical protein